MVSNAVSRFPSLLIRSTLWRILLYTGVRMFSLFPRPWRFTIALRITKVMRPLLQWTSLYRPPPYSLDDYRNHVLALILGRMTEYGIEFDPLLKVRGVEALAESGAIIISGHFYLNFVFLRWLFDEGRQVSFVTDYAPERWKITGTKMPLDVFCPDHRCLMGIRRRVKAGGFVAVAIDSQYQGEGWREVKMRRQTVYINDKIMRFAERAGIPVLFFATSFTKDGEIMTTLVRPSSMKAAVVRDEFCQFLCSEFSDLND